MLAAAARGNDALGLIDEDGAHLSQIRWYGGAPGALAVGKPPLQDTNNWPRVRALYEDAYEMAEWMLGVLFPGNKLLETTRSKLPLNKYHTPSSHNQRVPGLGVSKVTGGAWQERECVPGAHGWHMAAAATLDHSRNSF